MECLSPSSPYVFFHIPHMISGVIHISSFCCFLPHLRSTITFPLLLSSKFFLILINKKLLNIRIHIHIHIRIRIRIRIRIGIRIRIRITPLPPLQFNKKLLDFDYSDEEEDGSREEAVPQSSLDAVQVRAKECRLFPGRKWERRLCLEQWWNVVFVWSSG